MNDFKFSIKYNIILCTLSLLLDHFEKDNKVFAAQCIWWLASIIQFTEIVTYYQHLKIFPLDYINILVLTPLPEQLAKESIIPEASISALDLLTDSSRNLSNHYNSVHSSKDKILWNLRKNHQPV